jgi:hypothetical protein
MKTIKQFAIILALASLAVTTVNAQNIIQVPQQPKTKLGFNNQAPPAQNQGNPKPKGNEKWWINVGIGGGPNWGAPPPYYQGQNYGYGYGNNYGYNNYYGNYNGNYNGYGYRKVARRTIRKTAYIVHNAIQQAQWNGIYNPILSNAVNHQQYAKFLYNQGEYIGAMQHSKRARYLAWEAINFNYSAINNPGYDDWDDDDDYYGNGNGYNGGGYGTNYNDDDYKKNGNNNGNKQPAPVQGNQKTPSNEELDGQLKKKEIPKDEMRKIKLSDLDIQ